MTGKYKFNQAQRYAVYTAHKEQCYICGTMLTMQSVQIDHVVPESIATNADDLENARQKLGLPIDFEVNSYENWLPTCGVCNNKKNASVCSRHCASETSTHKL